MFRFWPESATKPDPMCCGYDWVVVAVVTVLMVYLFGLGHMVPPPL